MSASASEPKEASIRELLRQLHVRLGPATFEVVNHWDADLCAVGLTKPGVPLPLVYISTFNLPPGRYYVALEAPPNAGRMDLYEHAGELTNVDFEQLVRILSDHLQLDLSKARIS